MKIGIYTIHAAYNYGAMLQAYATQKVLEKMGHKPEIVNLYTKEHERKNESKKFSWKLKPFLIFFYARLNPKLQLKYKRFREFHQLLNLSKRYYNVKEIYESPPKYDVHLVGSDQVWNLQSGLPDPPYFFLDFVKKAAPKISFSSSFGTKNVDLKHYTSLKKLLASFNAISVREIDGVDIIKEAASLQATQVLDPTFLLSAEEWEKLAPKERIIKEDYILYYGFDDSDLSRDLIINLKTRTGLPSVALAGGVSFPFKVDYFMQEAGPREFIALFRDASFICTSSFHGLVYSIHFRKSFFTIPHPTRNSRMETVMAIFDLFDRQIEDASRVLDFSDEKLSFDYERIETDIINQTNKSLKWLQHSLDSLEKIPENF